MTTAEFVAAWKADEAEARTYNPRGHDPFSPASAIAEAVGVELREARSHLGKLDRKGLVYSHVARVSGRGRKNTRQTYRARFYAPKG